MDRNALFEENLKWAVGIARNIARKMPPSFDAQDLEQEARLEHWKRCEAYDPDKGVPYQGFAFYAIRGAVLMKCRRRHWTDAQHVEMDQAHADTRPLPDEGVELKHVDGGTRLTDFMRERGWQEPGGRSKPEPSDSERLYAAVRDLPPTEAYLIRRVHLDGEDLEVVARRWGLEVRAARKRLGRGVRLLKRAAQGGTRA